MQRKIYVHERPEWPAFRWNSAALANQLAAVRHHQGRLLGRMEALGFRLQSETTLQTLTQDALKTSEIEGELLNREQVRSSLARRLGLEKAGVMPVDRRADAIAAVVLDATQKFERPLTAERLFMWHRSLFPAGGTGRQPITVGGWRTDAFGAMIVTSGRPGREQIHFEAPSAARVPAEMARFLIWFEDKADTTDPVLKAAVAHFWFVTIHPFDDGNGRIGRAIADMALARSERTSQRFYSMSTRLRVERKAYYETLEAMQKGDLDITARLGWFLAVLDQALSDAEAILAATVRKSQFWEGLARLPINERQRKMLGHLIDGFEGKLTTSKWAQMVKCSQDTALRDITGLIECGVLAQDAAGGRSTSYSLTSVSNPPFR